MNSTTQSITVAPHNTEWIDLTKLWSQLPNASSQGGIVISYTGVRDAILAEGGMEDPAKGYSHMLHFWQPAPPPSNPSTAAPNASSDTMAAMDSQASATPPQPTTIVYDSPGLMVGTQDADMLFPQGTSFTPCATMRNTSSHPILVQLAANVQPSGKPTDISLGVIPLSPQQTIQADMKSILQAAGLASYNGLMHLRTLYVGNPGDLMLETSSVDQSLNYVFEVPPMKEMTGPARLFNYWNSGGDTDTMVSLWNYSNNDEDFILTFFHQEGKYEMPIHLAAHATFTMSMAKLIHSGTPDRNGKIIPVNIVQGAAKLASANLVHDNIDIAVSIATFNSRTGTCNYPCQECDGVQSLALDPGAFGLFPGGFYQLAAWAQYSDGSQDDVSSSSSWHSGNTSAATVAGGGMTRGVAVGAAVISANFSAPSTIGYSCQGCNPQGFGGVSEALIINIVWNANGQNVTGTTQSAVSGQLIDLTANYSLPPGTTLQSISWSLTGDAIGGYTGSPQSTSASITSATTTQQEVKFYWPISGNSFNAEVSILYNDDGGTDGGNAQVTFNISGPGGSPTVVLPTSGALNVDTLTGCATQTGGQYLDFGHLTGQVPQCSNPPASSGTFGITFTPPSISSPPGQFFFIQTVNQDTATYSRTGATLTCTAVSGLHGQFPYEGTYQGEVVDAPGAALASTYTTVSRAFYASMYLMWQSSTNSIPVPIGSLNWQVVGSTTQSGGTWGTPTGSGSAGGFSAATSASTGYPQYQALAVPATSNCH